MTSKDEGGNMVDADEGVDFDFLVEGDFFDGDEFQPVIVNEDESQMVNMAGGVDEDGGEMI